MKHASFKSIAINQSSGWICFTGIILKERFAFAMLGLAVLDPKLDALIFENEEIVAVQTAFLLPLEALDCATALRLEWGKAVVSG